MGIIRKTLAAALVLALVTIFFIALFFAIDLHIDGLGIFSIIAAIIFFSYIMFAMVTKKRDESNGISMLKLVKSTKFLHLILFTVLPSILSFLEKNKDRLERVKSVELQNELERVLQLFKGDVEPEVSKDKHKTK